MTDAEKLAHLIRISVQIVGSSDTQMKDGDFARDELVSALVTIDAPLSREDVKEWNRWHADRLTLRT